MSSRPAATPTPRRSRTDPAIPRLVIDVSIAPAAATAVGRRWESAALHGRRAELGAQQFDRDLFGVAADRRGRGVGGGLGHHRLFVVRRRLRPAAPAAARPLRVPPAGRSRPRRRRARPALRRSGGARRRSRAEADGGRRRDPRTRHRTPSTACSASAMTSVLRCSDRRRARARRRSRADDVVVHGADGRSPAAPRCCACTARTTARSSDQTRRTAPALGAAAAGRVVARDAPGRGARAGRGEDSAAGRRGTARRGIYSGEAVAALPRGFQVAAGAAAAGRSSAAAGADGTLRPLAPTPRRLRRRVAAGASGARRSAPAASAAGAAGGGRRRPEMRAVSGWTGGPARIRRRRVSSGWRPGRHGCRAPAWRRKLLPCGTGAAANDARRSSRSSRASSARSAVVAAGQQHARAHQLEQQPRRGRAAHLDEAGVHDLGGATSSAAPSRAACARIRSSLVGGDVDAGPLARRRARLEDRSGRAAARAGRRRTGAGRARPR